MAKLSTLYDAFDSSPLDTAKWNDSSNATVGAGTGYAAITASGSYTNRLGTSTPYDFTSDTFQWEWTFPSASPAGAEQYVQVFSGAAGQTIQMGRFQGSLGWDYNGASSQFVTFDATNHRYARIRTNATQVIFEASANGTTWTNPFTTNTVTQTWTPSSVIVQFLNAFFSGAGGGEMRIMQVGTPPVSVGGSKIYTTAVRRSSTW